MHLWLKDHFNKFMGKAYVNKICVVSRQSTCIKLLPSVSKNLETLLKLCRGFIVLNIQSLSDFLEVHVFSDGNVFMSIESYNGLPVYGNLSCR